MLVRDGDEDRWLAAQYAPLKQRRRLIALYAAYLEVARVRSQVREPPLGEIRLQWWRDGLASIAAGKTAPPHPVLQLMADASVGAEEAEALSVSIDAQARLLYREAFVSVSDFAMWIAAGEAQVATIACRLIAGAHSVDASAVECAAAAFGMARLGRGLAGPLYAGVATEARRLLAEARRAQPFTSSLMPALAHFALTPSYLKREAPNALMRRLRVFQSVATGKLV
ncbi:MAG: squalene/phytoene synthase family protein [Parvularculaceae bacterium]